MQYSAPVLMSAVGGSAKRSDPARRASGGTLTAAQRQYAAAQAPVGVGTYAGAREAHRSSASLRQVLQAEAPECLARHAQALVDAGVDGLAAEMLSSADVRELLPPATPVGERLALLAFVRDHAREPPPALPEDMLSERMVAYIASWDARVTTMTVCEAVLIVSGLLGTVSCGALLTPQCQSPYNEETGIVDLDPARKICSKLMAADIIAWSVSMSIELVSVVTGMMVLAMCTMLDEDTYKVWLVRNWRKAQLPVFLAVMGLCIAFPIAIALRVWLIVPPNIAGIVTAVIVIAFGVVVNVFWTKISNAAYGLMPLGPAYKGSWKQNNKINDGWLGQEKLRFKQALSAARDEAEQGKRSSRVCCG